MSFFHTEAGAGIVRLIEEGRTYDLFVPKTSNTSYSNAQISSYQSSRNFKLYPPVRLSLNAQAYGLLQGTAGFGFWNHPFAPGEVGFRLPKALWFFHGSQPNNMALAYNVPGRGWKIATMDATRPMFFGLLPFAPVGFLMMRNRWLYRHLWPVGQAAIGVHEYQLPSDSIYDLHNYQIDWLQDRVIFTIDNETIYEAPIRIRGTLGFIAWVDNQYAIVTPQGRFGGGLIQTSREQGLRLANIRIDPIH